MVIDVIGVIFSILYAFNLLFAVLVIFFEKRSPAVTWAWLFVVFLVPYVGFAFYILFGLDARKQKRFGEKARADAQMNEAFLSMGIKAESAYAPPKLETLSRLHERADGGRITAGNRVTPLYGGADKFASLYADIDKAEEYAHLLYYIVRDDGVGREFMEVLTRAARRGLDVRLTIDGMGCIFTPKSFFEPFKAAGGKLATFWAPRFVRHNYRNHRKLAVIDGRTAYIGGFNIGDEYVGKVRKFGIWRDTCLRVEGAAARDIELRFLMDWNYCGEGKSRRNTEKMEPAAALFPPIAPPNNEEEGRYGGVPVQIIASGPDTKWDTIYMSYGKMINEADERVYIQTPYFVPDDNIFESLRAAALAGVDVRVMIPEKPDHLFVHWASLSYLGELLNAGVRVYQYGAGFLHAKTLMADGEAAHVGTANMDVRSFKLNFEINAVVYDKALCESLEAKFVQDLNDCVELTAEQYAKRSWFVRIKESVSRLISPLL